MHAAAEDGAVTMVTMDRTMDMGQDSMHDAQAEDDTLASRGMTPDNVQDYCEDIVRHLVAVKVGPRANTSGVCSAFDHTSTLPQAQFHAGL